MAGIKGIYKEVLSGVTGGLPARPTHLASNAMSDHTDNGLAFVRHALDEGFLDKRTVNPFHRSDGERLDRGSFSNFTGLLVRGATPLTLDNED